MKRLLTILSIGMLFLLIGCAAKQLPPPQWTYERDAIQMHIKADPNLNLDDGEAHTLLLCAYQLSDPNTFNQLANDQDGLYKLLECKLFGDGAAASKRMIVQPGQEITVPLDRAEGARYVALVAGYYILETERMVKMVEVPEYIEKKGFLSKTETRKPAKLAIDLLLGPQQITTISTSTPKEE
ncbi:type VI secretion system lipoprotein TssJ [Desulfosarcina ovata]|uniref:Type VI secretion protein n=2 Tax=Desulfosarcina ovata TaxID=83564 RepID=A0A5K8A827_9BACT|nr:type VI secretion system lipoprotein TssJ [Desulfosarcina ovata]BBO81523.1 type VI secretion protein [Desulfosarcina ovata subsp. sediminis]BBO88782.1 type VI secretion protein [Desulfosarcina ovata subsp. ovata]